MNPATEGENGYNYLHDVFIPRLLDAGITEEQIHQMLVLNETRLLTITKP
ncbi:hypothetical protein [Vibrio aestuarianus]